MENGLIYLGKTIFISLVFWLYYIVFLRGKEFHYYNRFYLLSTSVISLILPLIKVNWFTIKADNNKLYQLILLLNGNVTVEKTTDLVGSFWHYTGILIVIISVFLLFRFIYSVFKIQRIKQKYPCEKHKGYTLIITDLDFAPFTFFKNLFWHKSIGIQTENGQKILHHELTHIKEKHTIDRIYLQLLKSLFWFNPIYYLYHREIALIHEYLADQKAIAKHDTKSFAQMLLRQHYTTMSLPGTSPFFSSTIKKRIKMLTKKQNTKFSYARRIWALPLLFLLSFVYLVQAKNKEIKAENKKIETIVNDLTKEKEPLVILPKAEGDTLKNRLGKKKKALEKSSEKLKKEAKEIKVLSKDLKKKNNELKRLLRKEERRLNRKEISVKLEEINELQSKVDEKIKNQDNQMSFFENDIDSDKIGQLAENISEKAGRLTEYFESEEWTSNIEKLEKQADEFSDYFESEEWKKEISKIEKEAEELSDYFNSDEWKESVEKIQKKAEKARMNTEKITISNGHFFNENIDWGNSIILLNGKEISKKEFDDFNKDEIKVFSMVSNSDKLKKKYNGKSTVIAIKTRDSSQMDSQDLTYKINGKTVSKKEVDNLNPKQIKSMKVNKKESLIEITTK